MGSLTTILSSILLISILGIIFGSVPVCAVHPNPKVRSFILEGYRRNPRGNMRRHININDCCAKEEVVDALDEYMVRVKDSVDISQVAAQHGFSVKEKSNVDAINRFYLLKEEEDASLHSLEKDERVLEVVQNERRYVALK